MKGQETQHCTAFQGSHRIASGSLVEVVKKVKEIIEQGDQASILIFDDLTSEPIEVDFRGTMADVLKRAERLTTVIESAAEELNEEQSSRRGPGRPKLGVVSREVTLLPRHWDWLNSQPGGASVALRKLVEEARRLSKNKDKIRHSMEVTNKFMFAMAGNLPGFEEATRALFSVDSGHFNELIASWPADIRDHIQKLSETAFRG